MDATQISCIAIDDEPKALSIIKTFAQKIEFLNLKQTFRNPLDAINYLNKNTVELIFLDINMPVLSGLEFLKSLSKSPPLIIFTTAYSEYAVESYEYEAVDYLLKPIAFPRFLNAVQKAIKRTSTPEETIREEEVESVLLLKSGGEIHRISPSDILYAESQGNYLKIVMSHDEIVIKSGLQDFLDKHNFSKLLRTHRSFAVNMEKVSKVKYNKLYIENQVLVIGRYYSDVVRTYFKR